MGGVMGQSKYASPNFQAAQQNAMNTMNMMGGMQPQGNMNQATDQGGGWGQNVPPAEMAQRMQQIKSPGWNPMQQPQGGIGPSGNLYFSN